MREHVFKVERLKLLICFGDNIHNGSTHQRNGCLSSTSSSVSSSNSFRSVSFTRYSTSSSVSTDIPRKPCSLRCNKPGREAVYLSFRQLFCTIEYALI